MMAASSLGFKGIVIFLMENGADLYVKDSVISKQFGKTALDRAGNKGV